MQADDISNLFKLKHFINPSRHEVVKMALQNFYELGQDLSFSGTNTNLL